MIEDLRFALRSLRRTPRFTLMSVLTLALGIGATTAIFTVVNAALFKPLPYADPDRLLTLGLRQGVGAQTGQVFLFMRERSRAFDHVAAQGSATGWNVSNAEVTTFAKGLRVSSGYFAALGATPFLGREFSRVEDEPNGPNVVVISEALWRRAFAARPGILGTVVELGGIPHAIVGVMPASFRSIPDADLWTPVRTTRRDNGQNYTIFARLRDDATVVQAATELDSLRDDLRREFPRMNPRRIDALVWTPYRNVLGRTYRQPLFVLLGAVAFLLLIACVNLAGLQLTRAAARRCELATRAALGGGRLRLARQVLVEALMLAIISAAAGIVVAIAATQLLLGLVSPDMARDILTGQPANLDWRVLAVTGAIALSAGVFFGTAPALLIARVDLSSFLAEGVRNTMSARTMWLRRSLVLVEVALSVVLLVGAGLLIRTLAYLNSVELGFNPERVIVGRMSLQGAVATGAELELLVDQALTRIRQVPGVSSAAVSNHVPIERGLNVTIEPPPGSLITEPRSVDWRYVTSGYFEVFGVPIRAGRSFDTRDNSTASPVAIVNEAFARAYFGRVDVVGEHLSLMGSSGGPLREIVGVVGDVKARSGGSWAQPFSALGSAAVPVVYEPAAQAPAGALQIANRFFNMTWAIKISGTRFDARAIEDAVRAVNPRLPFIAFEPLTAIVSRDLDLQRLVAGLLTAFAAFAVLLAALGLYGLLSYGATQRRREVSIRMALGATAARVLRAFMGEGLMLTAAGLLIGIVGAVLVTRVLSVLLFGVTALDRLTFAGVASLLLVIGASAAFLPALKAARTDPARVLRAE